MTPTSAGRRPVRRAVDTVLIEAAMVVHRSGTAQVAMALSAQAHARVVRAERLGPANVAVAVRHLVARRARAMVHVMRGDRPTVPPAVLVQAQVVQVQRVQARHVVAPVPATEDCAQTRILVPGAR